MENDEDAKWEILSVKSVDGDTVEFTCKHIETEKIKKCISGRSGWEWSQGELLNIDELIYYGQCE